MTEQFMTASRGRGVQYTDRRVRAEYAPMAQATCAIETKNSELLSKWNETAGEIRFTGCALLNFVNLAAGLVNVAIAQNMSPSDLASSMLIVQESGALTGDAEGKPVKMDKGELMAAPPKLFKQLMSRN